MKELTRRILAAKVMSVRTFICQVMLLREWSCVASSAGEAAHDLILENLLVAGSLICTLCNTNNTTTLF